ncbi:MAG: PDDEXK nuclease domain-containing protein [Desulfobacterales bacterium]|nr:PDDEXK nuclease domain-containing protein [Desulfobacterales bacterium]
MSSDLIIDKEYKSWLSGIKLKVRNVQIKAALKVQTELLNFYWELGADIVVKQTKARWGDGLIKQLSRDLMAEFPEMKGFSKRNLELIRQWYQFYSSATLSNQITQQAVSQLPAEQKVKQPVGQIHDAEKSQQVVDQIEQPAFPQITQIPWGHNIAIIAKCKNIDEALYYVQCTISHNWSRSVLVHQIESGLYKREGRSVHNFALTLPKPQSDLAVQTLKDPYIFDFLIMTKDYTERDLENALVSHVRQFLLELGVGFAYMGQQIAMQVGEREFFVDLLFYHTKLHCYVVVELKVVDFEPEHAGKLNFYMKAIDSQLRTEHDQPTIGILICKKKDRIVAEYALSDINKPIGVSEYRLTESIPDTFRESLPTVEQIEAELGESGDKF